jgi:chemotaxis protein methyltransferase CheR
LLNWDGKNSPENSMNTLFLNEIKLSEADFQTISSLVYSHCGIYLSEDKKELVRSRLTKRLRLNGIGNFSDYLEFLRQDGSGDEFSALVDSISTNFTSFFRERQHFDYLSSQFLPPLISKKSSNKDYRIRAWSAGCSSGEELYSMAITIFDILGGDSKWDVKILATDISTRMLKTAQKAVYDEKKIEPLTQTQRQKYLSVVSSDGQDFYQIKDCLRGVTIIKYLNLMEEWPIKTPLDFIFCRNVMIYFDRKTQQKLISRFWDALAPEGVLFTGHSESLAGITHSFKYIEPAVYQKPPGIKTCTRKES